jgi:nucleoside-diphosphate-sugar epimerase
MFPPGKLITLYSRKTKMEHTKQCPPENYIDVRDTARLHIAALLDPSIENERIFGFVHEFNWNDAISILRKLRPNNRRIPRAPVDEWRDEATVKPKGRAEEIHKSFWGRSWIGFEESLKDGIAGWD